MPLYTNHTRSDAVVTVKIISVQDPENALKIGIESAMKGMTIKLGVHDLVVPPSASIEVSDGVIAEFIAARGV